MARYEPIKDYSVNLVANYKFNETSGTTCIDSKGAYNGTYTGTTSVTENGETFRRFNGISDYVSFSNPVIPLGKKSIKFRIRRNGYPTNYEHIMVNITGGTTDYGMQITCSNNAGLHFYIQSYKSNRNGLFPTIAIPDSFNIFDNQWHDILFTWDGLIGVNNVKLFVDNLSVPISSVNGISTETTIQSHNLIIGKYTTANSAFFKGDLDNIEIYNEVLEYKNYKRFLIQDKTNVLYTLDTSGNIITSPSQTLDESNYLTNGFDNVLNSTQINQLKSMGSLSDYKLLMYTDNADAETATLNYNCDEYRPIDKTDEQFKILMYKEE